MHHKGDRIRVIEGEYAGRCGVVVGLDIGLADDASTTYFYVALHGTLDDPRPKIVPFTADELRSDEPGDPEEEPEVVNEGDFEPGSVVTLKDGSTSETAKVVSYVYTSSFGTSELRIRVDHPLRGSYAWQRDKLKIVDEQQ